MPMKILMVGYNLHDSNLKNKSLVSGEIKNANYLASALEEYVSVERISISLYGVSDTKYSIKKSKLPGVFRWIAESRELNRLLRSYSDDWILYLTIPSYLPFLRGTKRFKDIIITAHGTYWPELLADLMKEGNLFKRLVHLLNGYLQLLIDKIAVSRANRIHSVSEFQVKEMLEVYKLNRSKVFALRNCSAFQCSGDSINRSIDFLWVGRLAKKKNIQLFQRLAMHYQNSSTCIVAGNNYFSIDRASEEIVNDLKNFGTQVEKDLSDYELQNVYRRSKVLVVTSIGYESIPTVIFEALSCGCEVIAPNSWGIPEITHSSLRLYKEGHVEDFMKVVDDTIKEYDNNNLNNIEVQHTWEETAQEFIKNICE